VATIPHIREKIPVVILFRALGCVSDKEILNKIVYDQNDSELKEVMRPSLEESSEIMTEEDALDYIAKRGSGSSYDRERRIEYGTMILENELAGATRAFGNFFLELVPSTALEDRIYLVHDFLGELKPLKAFPEEILMVFIPIIKNAVQAMGAEGRLLLTTRQQAGDIIVTIEDNGPGIPEAYRHRIFDPFFTTKGQGQGTGLGLNTAYRILENFSGSIDMDSEEGRGTIFTLRFPANP